MKAFHMEVRGIETFIEINRRKINVKKINFLFTTKQCYVTIDME